MTQSDVILNQLRINRAVKLKETDWTQIVDAPLTAEKKTEFAVYRQALRDLPTSVANPEDIVWPVMPA